LLFQNSEGEIVKFLIGNKTDLNDLRVVEYSKGLRVANQFGLEFFETSAKDNTNINEIFIAMARYLVQKVKLNFN
jgi:Ras-related protein Rab-8A